MTGNPDNAVSPEESGSVWTDAAALMQLEHRITGLRFTPYLPRSSILAGRYGSRIRGRGLDFEELRAYLPGDDVRNIDWKATERAGKPLLRAYTEERDRPVLLVVDQRMTMFFGSRRATKSVIAAEFAALAAWMGFHAGDRVGAVLFSDDEIRTVRPLRSRLQVQEILAGIAAMNRGLRADKPIPPGMAQLDEALKRVRLMAKHDGLICIVSDFAGAGAETGHLLRQIVAHNDVVAGLVFDPMLDAIPPRAGNMAVTEGVLQMELDFSSASVRDAIAAFYRDRLAKVTALLKGANIPLMPVNTRDATIEQLRGFLGKRARRAGRRA